jgi:hypothetical protein
MWNGKIWTHCSNVAGTTIEVVNVGSGSNVVFKVSSNRPIIGEGMPQVVESTVVACIKAAA